MRIKQEQAEKSMQTMNIAGGALLTSKPLPPGSSVPHRDPVREHIETAFDDVIPPGDANPWFQAPYQWDVMKLPGLPRDIAEEMQTNKGTGRWRFLVH